METQLTLKTSDGYTIYGTRNASSKKTKKLLIFVHGLTGHRNEHLFYNAARFFPKKGFDTFRFDLYNGDKGGRKLSETTVSIHAADLEVVLNYFKNTYKKMSVVGHSLGGPTIVYADVSCIQSIILWDPSDMLGLKDIVEGQERSLRRHKMSEGYIADWGVEYLLGKKMGKEFKILKPAEFVGNIQKPIKIISAENGNTRGGKLYFSHANSPKDFIILKGAGHTFDEEGVEEKLFEETLKWIKKYG